jgi:hypothetical protein
MYKYGGLFGTSWTLDEIELELQFDDMAFKVLRRWERLRPVEEIDVHEVLKEAMRELICPLRFDRQDVRRHLLKRLRMWCDHPSTPGIEWSTGGGVHV